MFLLNVTSLEENRITNDSHYDSIDLLEQLNSIILFIQISPHEIKKT